MKICGYLKNKKGKPIKHANIMISSGWALHNSVFTNDKGYYAVKVMPYYSSYRQMWSEYAITPRVKGYRQRSVIVKPGKKTDTVDSYCARLSHDNSLLAYSSTDGDLWLIDWKQNKILWQAKAQGQIRTIDYSADDSLVYLTCGAGYALCYDTATGAKKWETFIQGWGTESTVSGRYFITTTKSDGYALLVLDRITGKKLWDYPVDCRGTGIAVSPDGRKLWWGNDKGGDYSPVNSAVFELKTGKLLTVFTCHEKYSGMQAKWSRDGKRILIKDGQGFGVYDSSTGEPYFEKKVVSEKTSDSLCFSLYASDDLRYVVAGYNTDTSFRFGGSLFFFTIE